MSRETATQQQVRSADRPGNDPLNLEAALERLMGDVDLLEMLVQQFLEEIPTVLEEIKSALDQGDAEAVYGKAHRLKGAAGNLSADAVAAAALRLEQSGRDGDLDDGSAAMGVLQDCVADLQGFVSRIDWSTRSD